MAHELKSEDSIAQTDGQITGLSSKFTNAVSGKTDSS